MTKFSLRQKLVLPFVFLVLFVSSSIGWISFRAGERAVADLTERILVDIVSHIGGLTEQHLGGAMVALDAVVPDPRTVPKTPPFPQDLRALEQRLWVASGLAVQLNNYVYFGGADGRFAGVNRVSKDFVELYLREPGAPKRTVYDVNQPGDRARILRTDDYDPRQRPWYQAAIRSDAPVWSPIYNDFTSRLPTITLAKTVRRADGSVVGVLATDVTLTVLSDFLRTLSVSRNGVAFLVDADGYVIASSGEELTYRMIGDVPRRKHAAEMETPIVRQAFARILEWRRDGVDFREAVARGVEADGGVLKIGAVRIGQRHGVNWMAVVVTPRADFMGGVNRSLQQAIVIGAACVLLAMAVGLLLLNRLLRDLRVLTNAARRIGEGEPMPVLNIRRRDEIGQLAQTFSEMEHNLRIDKLTAVFNRESLQAQVAFLQRQSQNGAAPPCRFALLFIDLDDFKSINDRYGHAAGDQALVAVASRIRSAVRATDVVARYGGDEFVVLLKGEVGADEVLRACEAIRGAAEAPITLEHATVHVGVSIGWARHPEDGADVKALLKVADSRMFDTKKERKSAR